MTSINHLRKAIFLIVGLAILLWFVYEIRVIVLLFAFAFILAIVLNAPVTWLEGRSIRRGIAILTNRAYSFAANPSRPAGKLLFLIPRRACPDACPD